MVDSRRTWFGDDADPHTSPASSSQPRTFFGMSLLLSRTQDRLGGTVPLSNRAQCQGRGKKTRQAHTMFPSNHPYHPTVCSSGTLWVRLHYCVISNPLWTSLLSHLPLNLWGFLIYPCSLHTLHFPFTGRNERTAGKSGKPSASFLMHHGNQRWD